MVSKDGPDECDTHAFIHTRRPCCSMNCAALRKYATADLPDGLSGHDRVCLGQKEWEEQARTASLSEENWHGWQRTFSIPRRGPATGFASQASHYVTTVVARTWDAAGGRNLRKAPTNVAKKYKVAMAKRQIHRRPNSHGGTNLMYANRLATKQDLLPSCLFDMSPLLHHYAWLRESVVVVIPLLT